jgi:signal transduction histidine kinase
MTDRTARRIARGSWLVTIGLSVVFVVLFVVNIDVQPPGATIDFAQSLPFMLAASTLGALIVARHPRNLVGWLLCYCALTLAITDALQHYAVFAYLNGHPELPFARWAAWVQSFGIEAFFPLALALLILVFPDGRLPSPRWRVLVGVALLIDVVGLTAMALQRGPLSVACCEVRLPVSNPIGMLGVPSEQSWGGFLIWVLGFLLVFPASVVGLLRKRRRADPEQRQQIRWLASVTVFVTAGLLGSMILQTVLAERWRGAGDVALSGVLLILSLGVPGAMAIAVLKYRLYDLDLVIRKTVVFTVVAFTLTALYLGVLAVATIGAVPRILVGVILLAVTFNPVRKAARSIADRIVYGRRASSYEVLSDFSGRMADTYATEDVPVRLAAIVAGATGAVTARVWLRIGNTLRPEAESGAHSPAEARPILADALPEIAGESAFEVRHQGELLGALSVTMPANDPLDPGRERLVRDLAAQAGLVLRNVVLIGELRASRQRLVAAQDEERHRLERNIHDGAQQQLVALAVKARLARRLGENDPAKAAEILGQIEGELSTALEDLRDLARGIYPPLLADKGLAVALEAQARRSPVPVTVAADGVGRFPQPIEAAVYFSCLEALQNVAKYAEASNVVVRISDGAGELRFEISDDGIGFDPASTGYGTGLQGLRDRLEALGGEVDVRSEPGSGTTVAGHIPAHRGDI